MAQVPRVGRWYTIIDVVKNQAVDLDGFDNTSVVTFTPNPGANQRWILEEGPTGRFLIKSVLQTCLAVSGNAQNGARLICSNIQQEWDITPDPNRGGVILRYPGTSLVIDVCEQCDGVVGTKLQLMTLSSPPYVNRAWRFEETRT